MHFICYKIFILDLFSSSNSRLTDVLGHRSYGRLFLVGFIPLIYPFYFKVFSNCSAIPLQPNPDLFCAQKLHTCCLRKTIGKLRQEFCHLFDVDAKDVRRTRLTYYDMGMLAASGPEDIRNLNRQLYTYHPEDGDMIELSFRG